MSGFGGNRDGLRQRRRAGSEDDDSSAKRKPRITLEAFDLYTKVRDEEAVATTSGATVTLISVVLCLVLVASEVYRYVVPTQKEHMVVDPGIEGRLRINFDITFPALQCSEANLDAMDVAGEQQNGIDHDMTKTRLAADGTQIGDAFAHVVNDAEKKEGDDAEKPLPPDYCGSCYGAESREGQCCNTCDDVRDAYASRGWNVGEIASTSEQCARERRRHQQQSQPGEGCRLTGLMMVNKVAGNFHVAMGETHTRGAGHIHQFNPNQIASYNVSHIINSLSFGEPYPGIRNPLDGTVNIVREGTGVFMYFAKVIPTIYRPKGAPVASAEGEEEYADDGSIETNQYSITSQYRPAIVDGMRQNILPGLFFVYDFSPFQVTVTQHRPSLTELVTSLCAILGGVITAAGLVDAALFTLQKRLGVKSLGGLLTLLGDGHASMAAKVPGAAPPGVGVGGGGSFGGGGGAVMHTSPMHQQHHAAPAYGGGSPMPPMSGLGGGHGSPLQPAAGHGSPYAAPLSGGGHYHSSPPTSSFGSHAGPAAMPPHVS